MRTTPLFSVEPRSFAGTAVMIGSITSIPFALLWSWLFAAMQQSSFGEVLPFGLFAGLLFGFLFGPVMASFFKGETATVQFVDRKRFVTTLHGALSQLGYHPGTDHGDFITYRPSLQAGLLAGRISVHLGDEEAVMVGPKIYIERLLQRLDRE